MKQSRNKAHARMQLVVRNTLLLLRGEKGKNSQNEFMFARVHIRVLINKLINS